MSKLSVTTVESVDGTTALTLQTANTLAGSLKIQAANSDIIAKGSLIVTQNNAQQLNLTGEIAEFAHNTDGYAQVHIRNASSGVNASGDFIVTADTGNDTNDYVDFGINGSGYNQATWTINGARDAYLYAQSQNLSVGVANSGKSLSFFAGGTLSTNEKMRVTPTGVGVGKTNPTTALDVTGNVNVSATLTATTLVGYGSGFSNATIFTTPGTGSWSIPTGVNRWKVTVIGAGGSGGSTRAGLAATTGAGGGSGGVVIGYYNFVSGSTTMSYGVGERGAAPAANVAGINGQPSNTSYNNIILDAGGGVGGSNSIISLVTGGSGTGGTAANGTINLVGADGDVGGTAAATTPIMGRGAASPLGFGQPGPRTNGAIDTAASKGYGAGGSGGYTTSTTARLGGAGANGAVIIEW